MTSRPSSGCLPSYAQPTQASAKHSTPKTDLGKQSLRAGTAQTSARGSRPSSKGSTPKRRVEGPLFLSLFKSPGDDSADGLGTRSKSSTYRPPKLVERMDFLNAPREQTKPLALLISETEMLLGQFSSCEDFTFFHDKDMSSGDQDQLAGRNWNQLVTYHTSVMAKVQQKTRLDHKLIQNVMELNNAISTAMRSVEIENEKLASENKQLREQATGYYAPMLSNDEHVTLNSKAGIFSSIINRDRESIYPAAARAHGGFGAIE